MKSQKLGLKGRDKITGFEGIITGHCEYVSGCDQLLIVPCKLTKEGKRPESEWFDDQRVEIIGAKRIIFDNSKTPGSDLEAPKN